MKVGEGNPQAREEEGQLYLLSTECSSSPAGIPRMWGLEFCGKATAFYQKYLVHNLPVLNHKNVEAKI